MLKQTLLFLSIAAAFAATLSAQTGVGQIQGTLNDAAGAVVPGATVILENAATNIRFQTTSSDVGFFVFPSLVPGEYTVTVTAGGFQTLSQEHVVVDALSVVGLNLALKIGAAAEQVTITDTPPQLNTVDASMGQTIRNEQYTALPLAMGNAPRDPTAFAALMPGVTGSTRLPHRYDAKSAPGSSTTRVRSPPASIAAAARYQ